MLCNHKIISFKSKFSLSLSLCIIEKLLSVEIYHGSGMQLPCSHCTLHSHGVFGSDQ